MALCLLAYPRQQRAGDGAYLLDLADEFAGARGAPRQAVSLLLGGLRARAARRHGRLVLGGLVAAVLALVGGPLGVALALTGTGSSEVELYACSTTACPAAAELVADRQRDGWTCARLRPGAAAVEWRCTR